ncbi:MAG: D-glycero-beta-D-manno-heptose-7-phosphate kinase [Pyrinomonadaceae bacterium]
MKILKNFSRVRVLVIGDIMLDQYWWGNVKRISPEAPVPVVRLERTSLVAGGAANVAANVAGLGANPFLIGVIGNDTEGRQFKEILEKNGVPGNFLIKSPERPTTIKTRVVAHSQQVVRIDREVAEGLSEKEEKSVWRKAERLFSETDIVVISDYAKGVLTEELLSRLITKGKAQKKMILIDPKGKDYRKYAGASLLTPNKKEAAEACGLEEDGPGVIKKAGEELIKRLQLEALLITRGEEGMTLFRKGKPPVEQKALARKVYDVTGAGDTVISTLAVALAAGGDPLESSQLANTAAGLVVEKMGTTTIKFNDLKKGLRG